MGVVPTKEAGCNEGMHPRDEKTSEGHAGFISFAVSHGGVFLVEFSWRTLGLGSISTGRRFSLSHITFQVELGLVQTRSRMVHKPISGTTWKLEYILIWYAKT
jgi:hypothetical protein